MGLYSEAAEMERDGKPFAVVTITGTEGTVPRRSGRMIVSEDGCISGTIGGGEIEHRARLLAIEALKEGRHRCTAAVQEGCDYRRRPCRDGDLFTAEKSWMGCLLA